MVAIIMLIIIMIIIIIRLRDPSVRVVIGEGLQPIACCTAASNPAGGMDVCLL
jgi:hypothetical protein